MRHEGKIVLRPARVTDIPTLEFWDRQPHVVAATGFDPRAGEGGYWEEELALVRQDFQILIATLEGRPIGVLQLIDPHTEPTHYWGDIEPNLRALDIWIGDADDLGQGYGETMMRLAFQMCFADEAVTGIVIDPLLSNVRAHRFYQRLGFVPEGERQFDEDLCLIHRLTRQVWREKFPND